ncbi:hypothetical protein [Fundicoccus culcitae]|uniref:Uncharacterized protein n=1 Tax=Fundicoccus culcitae TaxID=2969821 RepID=A0ABY5P8R7_9LACT|nr:hypothetical protein [Fundicoccus culcitae]UUX35156.1 hypothetical protein NRE15_05810 [Fundicoccus culcitae]
MPDFPRNRRPALPNFPAISSTCRISFHIDVHQTNLPDFPRNRRPALPNFPAISSTCRISFHIDVHQTNLPAVTLNRRPAFPLPHQLVGSHFTTTSAKSTFGLPTKSTSAILLFLRTPTNFPELISHRRPAFRHPSTPPP